MLETEPERLLPQLTQSAPQVQEALRAYLVERLAGEELCPGVTPEDGADWLARIGISLILAPGRWDLEDPVVVRRLVRERLLVGILAPAALAAVADVTEPDR